MSTTTASIRTPLIQAEAGPWQGFTGGRWADQIDVRDFIQANLTPYTGDAAFLAGPTDRTRALWSRLNGMFVEERDAWHLRRRPAHPGLDHRHAPGYIDRERELIVGLQTDAPLRRAIMPNGGLRMVEAGLAAYGYTLDPAVREIFTRYRKTHNDGVFDAYPADVLAARRAHIITGLPDAYGRGRIIGDYRRVPLYGVDRLVAAKKAEKAALDARPSTADVIRDREELAEQIRALGELTEMAASYGVRRQPPRGHRPGGDPVAVLRLPRRGEGAERRGDVARPHLDLPRHLPRARPARGPGSPSRRRRS